MIEMYKTDKAQVDTFEQLGASERNDGTGRRFFPFENGPFLANMFFFFGGGG